MANYIEHIRELFRLYVNDEASDEQVNELLIFLKAPQSDVFSKDLFFEIMNYEHSQENKRLIDLDLAWSRMLEENESLQSRWNKQQRSVYENTHDEKTVVPVYTIYQIHRFIRKGYLRYAAAVIILLGLGIAVYLGVRSNKSELPDSKADNSIEATIGEKATLTLSDGRKIILDNAANGELANEGGAHVMKQMNGQIAYDLKQQNTKELLWNTMSTPRGGQYRIILPDGTRVWLNAASSIRYPVVFSEKERMINVTGEVYLEVASDNKRPFRVNVDDRSLVEVLGTHFNIDAYRNEQYIRTTLLDGAVRVSSIDSRTDLPGSANAKKAVILKPGEQARIVMTERNNSLSNNENNVLQEPEVIRKVDLQQVISWKNGSLNFENLDLRSMMRKVERWYDIEVKYEGQPPAVTFKGEIDKEVQLSGIIRLCNEFGIKTKLDGRTLIIKGN